LQTVLRNLLDDRIPSAIWAAFWKCWPPTVEHARSQISAKPYGKTDGPHDFRLYRRRDFQAAVFTLSPQLEALLRAIWRLRTGSRASRSMPVWSESALETGEQMEKLAEDG
jgi:hypothetical protein